MAMSPAVWVAAGAVLALLIGLALMLGGRGLRYRLGLGR
jgi:ABC-type phosphate transport system auxiliary subunit